MSNMICINDVNVFNIYINFEDNCLTINVSTDSNDIRCLTKMREFT